MANHFDELAKSLAGGMSRREALRRFGLGLGGALLATFGLGTMASAAGGFCGACNRFPTAAERRDCREFCNSCRKDPTVVNFCVKEDLSGFACCRAPWPNCGPTGCVP
jgi:hypothetical protein